MTSCLLLKGARAIRQLGSAIFNLMYFILPQSRINLCNRDRKFDRSIKGCQGGKKSAKYETCPREMSPKCFQKSNIWSF